MKLPLQKQVKMKGNSVFVNDLFQEVADQWQYLSSIKKISEKDILQIVTDFSEKVLTERFDHVNELYELFKGFVKNIIVLSGAMKKKDRQQKLEELIKLPDDDARLDTLFLTMPISWKGTLQQYVGRLHRDHSEKEEVKVFDYVDSNIDVLQRMFEKRLKGYKNIGYSLYGENNEKSQQIQLF